MELDEKVFSRVVSTITEHFQCVGKRITPETTAPEIHGWDSLAHTIVIMKIERAFGIEIADEKIFRLRNVGDLALAVQEALNGQA
jgi:acyl carrier protein